MKALSVIILLSIFAAWIGGAALIFFSAKKEKRYIRWIVRAGSIFMAIGASAFFGAAASAIGLLNWLPHTFEWPMGYTTGIVSTTDHFFAAPHEPSGRVQIYDSRWKFVRGWRVDAHAGSFKLKITDTNHVHVLTARGKIHYIFDIDGQIISRTADATDDYNTFGNLSQTHWVPTPFWLLPFSSPFLGWACCLVGVATQFAAKKRQVIPKGQNQ